MATEADRAISASVRFAGDTEKAKRSLNSNKGVWMKLLQNLTQCHGQFLETPTNELASHLLEVEAQLIGKHDSMCDTTYFFMENTEDEAVLTEHSEQMKYEWGLFEAC